MDTFKCKYCGKENPKKGKSYTNTYCNNRCQKDYEWEQRKQNIIEGKGNHRGVKRYLLEKSQQCNNCGNQKWLNQPIPLELNHKNGDSTNNTLGNVELLCPNCHALTPTYKNRNYGNGRHSRRERYKNGKSY